MQSPLTLLLQGTVQNNSPVKVSPQSVASRLTASDDRADVQAGFPLQDSGDSPSPESAAVSFTGIYAGLSQSMDIMPGSAMASSAVKLTADSTDKLAIGLSIEAEQLLVKPNSQTLLADYFPVKLTDNDVSNAVQSNPAPGIGGNSLPGHGNILPVLASQVDRTIPVLDIAFDADAAGNQLMMSNVETASPEQTQVDSLINANSTIEEAATAKNALPVIPDMDAAPGLGIDLVRVVGPHQQLDSHSADWSGPFAAPASALASVGVVEQSQPLSSLALPQTQGHVALAEVVQPTDSTLPIQASSDMASTDIANTSLTSMSEFTLPGAILNNTAGSSGLAMVNAVRTAVSAQQNLQKPELTSTPLQAPVSDISQFIASTRQLQQATLVSGIASSNAVADSGMAPGFNLSRPSHRAMAVDNPTAPGQSAAGLTVSGSNDQANAVRQVSSAHAIFSVPPALSTQIDNASSASMLATTAFAEPLDSGVAEIQSATTAARAADTSSLSSPLISSADINGKPGMLDMSLPFRHPQWSEALSQRVSLMHGKNVEQVQIQLDPPELGPLQIKINMQGDQVSVQFSSPHGMVRDAVEQTSQRLAQLFSQEGIELLDVSVSDGGNEKEGRAALEDNDGEDFGADADSVDEILTQLSVSRLDNGQIDYFV